MATFSVAKILHARAIVYEFRIIESMADLQYVKAITTRSLICMRTSWYSFHRPRTDGSRFQSLCACMMQRNSNPYHPRSSQSNYEPHGCDRCIPINHSTMTTGRELWPLTHNQGLCPRRQYRGTSHVPPRPPRSIIQIPGYARAWKGSLARDSTVPGNSN